MHPRSRYIPLKPLPLLRPSPVPHLLSQKHTVPRTQANSAEKGQIGDSKARSAPTARGAAWRGAVQRGEARHGSARR